MLCGRIEMGIGNVVRHLFMMGGEHSTVNLGVVIIRIKYLLREC